MKASTMTPIKLIAALVIVLIAGLAAANESNKWRLQFSGGAHSDGEIVLRLSPIGADPIVVTVAVPGDTSENGVAKIVVATLKETLPSEAFHVERDDGEDVLIKKRHGAANFGLEVISNTVKHVRIRPDRE